MYLEAVIKSWFPIKIWAQNAELEQYKAVGMMAARFGMKTVKWRFHERRFLNTVISHAS
jgi:hypothetical protein